MSVELNPCRCGGKAALGVGFAYCTKCGAQGPWCASPEKAAAKWAEFCPVAREPEPPPFVTPETRVCRRPVATEGDAGEA